MRRLTLGQWAVFSAVYVRYVLQVIIVITLLNNLQVTNLLLQVGAWGCFDEFNRLEERILSAVSQQILTIQRGLIERQNSIELLGRPIRLHENVGIFVTMNPGKYLDFQFHYPTF